MADFSKIISAVAQALNEDTALNALVDGQVVPGFRRSKADQYLAGANKACVGVRFLNENSIGLPGCSFHGLSDEDLLIEIAIININTDDSYAAAIASAVKDILKKCINITMNGVEYQIDIRQISFKPLDDDQAPSDWIQLVGTARAKYLG